MPQPALLTSPLTLEDAARLDPDEFPGEIVDGTWIPGSRNTWNHGEVIIRLSLVLGLYAREHPQWRVAAGDPGVRLAREPARLRGPDVAVLSAERRPTGDGQEGWVDGAPELCVEVVRDAETGLDVTRKALEYLRAGGRLVWVVDPRNRLVVVLGDAEPLRILGPEDTLTGGEVLPGFSCSVAELFE